MKAWGCDSGSNAAFEIAGVPSSRLLQVEDGVYTCLCMYALTLSSVSTVLAGRCCLYVALSHHLFLARLLITLLIISCSPLSVQVGCTRLVCGLYPILCYPSIQHQCHLSIQPDMNPPLKQLIFVSSSITQGEPSCTFTIDATSFKLPFWERKQTTNSSLPHSS